MTHLNIQQGQNIEVVSTSIIKKLYEAALSVPEPLEGEQDAAYMSGNLQVDRTYRAQVQYLTTRFPDLHINVTDSYYIPFEDSNVQSVLMANNISSDGIGITETDASTANLGTIFKDNTAITSFNEFGYFSRANSSPSANMFRDCTNLEEIDLSNVTTIGDFQFFHTAITDINVPNLTQMSGSAQFSACHQLETISSLGHISNIPVSCFRDCENLQSVVLQDECVTLSIEAFFMSNDYQQYGGSLQTVSGINRVSVFGESCFSRQYHLRLSASDLQSAVRIDKNAFWYVPVLSINCPKLTSLGFGAFRENKVLTNIECLGKISSIPDFCFNADTALQIAKIPYECTVIGSNAFNGCSSLTSIAQYNKSLDDYAEGESPTFTNMSRITSFGQNCFYNCQSLSLTASDLSGAVSIGSSAFENTLLSGDIVLPQLSAIGGYAFKGTRITSIDLTGSSISELPKGVFSQCSSLSKISIPTSVTTLGEHWCDGIANVLTLEGFDNCVNHSQNNWQLYNKTILNPIKTGFVSDGSAIMYLYSNDTNINYNQLYNPSLTSINPGRRIYNSEYYTYFVGRPGGGPSRVNIGLLYFRDISSFGALTFFKCNIDNLVINNVTPPTLNYSTEASWRYYNTQVWDNNIFPTGNSDQNDNVVIGTLWVPDSAVATYQADPLYSHLNIKGINTKTNGIDYDLPRYATYAAWKAAEEAAAAQGGHTVTGIIEEYM